MQFLGLIQLPYVKHRTKPFDVLMTCKKKNCVILAKSIFWFIFLTCKTRNAVT